MNIENRGNRSKNNTYYTIRNFISKISRASGYRFILDTVEYTGHTYVTCKYDYYSDPMYMVHVDLTDCAEYADQNSMSLDSAALLITSHEVMHVVLDHFNKKHFNRNAKLFNIAADLEVNSYINLEKPALRASLYGLPDFLTAEQYYTALVNQAKVSKKNAQAAKKAEAINDSNDSGSGSANGDETTNDKDEFVNVEDESSEDTNDNINNENKNSEEENEPSSNNEENDDDLDQYVECYTDPLTSNSVEQAIRDQNDELSVGGTKGNLRTIASHATMSDYAYKKIVGLAEIIQYHLKIEQQKEIVPHTRQATYTKFNNRRRNGNIVLPGKKIVSGGIQKKYNTSLTVFVDVSGSTNSFNDALMSAAKDFYDAGATIVYYDISVQEIVRPGEIFVGCSSSGCTSIYNAIKAYTDLGNKIERAIVITDGRDKFNALDEVTDKYTVYYIYNEHGKTKIKKLIERK